MSCWRSVRYFGKSSGSIISDSIHEETQELKKLSMTAEEKFTKLEEAIIANSSFGNESRQIFRDCDPTNIFVLDVIKDRTRIQ